MRHIHPACLLLAASLLAPGRSEAAWSTTPLGATTVTGAAADQYYAAIAADGSGGAFVAWIDTRVGTYDIYASHVQNGANVTGWTTDGVPVCTTLASPRGNIVLVPGSSGDVYVLWQDYRAGNYDIYAQRLLANGVVAPGWPVNGLALTNDPKNQYQLRACTDGADGFYAVWTLEYTPGSDYDIYAARVLPGGTFASGFGVNGLPINAAILPQQYPDIAPDGAGNAIIAFENLDASNNGTPWAQLLGPAGQRSWGNVTLGVQISSLGNNQRNVRVVTDGTGGAIIASDLYVGTAGFQYLWWVNASGGVHGYDDATVGGSLGGNLLSMVPDGSAGAWYEVTSGLSPTLTFTLFHVDGSGTYHPSSSGITLGSYCQTGFAGPLAARPDGGVVAILDPFAATYSVEAQAFDASGAALWNYGSLVPIAQALGYKLAPVGVPDGQGGAIVAWSDNRTGNYNVYANRVDRFGAMGDASPLITTMTDVPNDQGGFVNLQWNASYMDVSPDFPIARYSVWRRAPGAPAAGSAPVLREGQARPAGVSRVYRAQPTSVGVVYWALVSDTPARGYAGYSAVVPTTSDSLPGSNPLTYLRVEAETAGGIPYWDSAPDSGYSVDNIPPAKPAPFVGAYAAGATQLHWGANTEPDLAGYRLYRGATSGFVPGPGNLVVAKPDTGYADGGPAGRYYKLSAVDIHGNESAYALLAPTGVTGVGGSSAPLELAFAAPRPNPASGLTVLAFTLPARGAATLAVYDTEGRRVRTLSSGELSSGQYAVPFDLNDAAGRRLPGGLYFARLETAGRTLVRRLAIVE